MVRCLGKSHFISFNHRPVVLFRVHIKPQRRRKTFFFGFYMGCILTLVPAVVFWRRLPAAGGILPPGISRVLEHIATKYYSNIPAIPMFSGSNFSIVPLPISRDVDIRQKSKMAVAKMKCTYFTAVWLMKDNF